MICYHLDFNDGKIIKEKKIIQNKSIFVKKFIYCKECNSKSYREYIYNCNSKSIYKHFQCTKFINF